MTATARSVAGATGVLYWNGARAPGRTSTVPNVSRLAAVLVAALVVVPLTACVSSPAETAPAASPTAQAPGAPTREPAPAADPRFAGLEERFDARLGVYALDTGTGKVLEHRGEERFAYASTIKAFAAAAVLEATTGAGLDERVDYTAADLLDYAPITGQHVDSGMTLRELCDAAVRYSDNTAANLLFDHLGGPSALDAALARWGDDVTRVDREEPALNEATPGDPRDTTTPRAFGTTLEALVLGDLLRADDRATLRGWLVGNTTGDSLVRAGVPAGWTVGDKTGSAEYGTRNDIAVAWPAEGAPVVLVVLSSRDEVDAERDDALIAEATVVALAALGR
jgi:beta-lactamase class A